MGKYLSAMKNPPKDELAGGCIGERRSQNFVKKFTASPMGCSYSNFVDLAVIVKNASVVTAGAGASKKDR